MEYGRIKILYVVSTLRRTGPTRQLLGLVKNLNKDAFKVKILTLSPEPIDTMIKEFIDADIEVDSLNLSRAEFVIKGKSALKKYIEKYNPDIIHTSGIRADTAVSNMKLMKKHCMTVRNYVYEDYISKYGNIIGKIAAMYGIKSIRNCKYVICCSKTLKHMYEKILPAKELYVVQNGIDIDKFKPSLNFEEKISKRQTLGIPQECMVFLAVGSLIKRKDPISIIKAFKNANYKNKAILILLGDGELMEQCKNESDENVIIKGNVKNVEDYLKAADVYISASRSEGLPNSVLEAGSCGLNLILSDIPQHREIFEENPSLVRFFKVGDIEDLSSQINKLLKENKRDVNLLISEYIRDKFSDKVMSKNYEKIYYYMIGRLR